MHTASRPSAKVLAVLALLALSALALSACGTHQTASNTWLQPNQNASNTRYVGGRISSATISTVAVGWTADQRTAAGNGITAPSPYITSDRVFVLAPGDRLTAFDLQTGAPNPAASMKGNFIRQLAGSGAISSADLVSLSPDISPILTTGKDDARIIVGAKGSTVKALSAGSGKSAWSRTLESPKNTRPVVIANMAAAHDTIYVPVVNVPADVASRGFAEIVKQVTADKKNNGQLVAVDAENGKVRWTKRLASVPFGAATVVNDILFTSTLDAHVYGFNSGNGDQVFESRLPAGAVAPLAAYGPTLIVPAGLPYKRGQKAQVVAFTVGGLGVIGGVSAPRIKQQSSGSVAKSATPSEASKPAAASADGAKLFAADCAGCHTLKAANATGKAGPDLDTLKPSEAIVDKQVTNGGVSMPAFKDKLSKEEIAAIAKYVSSVAGK